MGELMSRTQVLAQLRGASPAILPSMLQCDFGNLRAEVSALEQAGAVALHLDVMDGHFVPNLTYGLTLVKAFRSLTTLPLDVHLMISNPEDYLEQYVAAGADMVSIHVEAVSDARPLLRKLRDLGCLASLAFNPETPLEKVENCLEDCDAVLIMSVNPGFGGQEFQPVALEKLRHLRQKLDENVLLEVDGGVNEHTIGDCQAAGADLFVVGSGIFSGEDYSARLEHLNRYLTEAGRH